MQTTGSLMAEDKRTRQAKRLQLFQQMLHHDNKTQNRMKTTTPKMQILNHITTYGGDAQEISVHSPNVKKALITNDKIKKNLSHTTTKQNFL